MRFVGLVVLAATSPRMAAAGPTLERQRCHDVDAVRSTELKRARVRLRHLRIAPQQQPLRPRPDAKNHAVLAILAQQVRVAIAREAARAAAQREKPLVAYLRLRPLLLANVRLMIRQAPMLRPEHPRTVPTP